MWPFKSKKDEVLNHWIAFADNFSLSPTEFYAALEKELVARAIPGLEISQVEYAEGGLLSHQRLYLRFIRERLAFDTCAAPFGRGYFFSCRSVYSPVILRLWHVLVALIFTFGIFLALWKPLGFNFALVATLCLPVAIAQVFRNTLALHLEDLDAALMKIPAIGPIYEQFFRVDTYYRQDTRLVYLDAVSKLVREMAEEITAANGVKLVRQFEQAPILGELYKPVPTKPMHAAPVKPVQS
jgi:hypothetical protein